MFLNRSFVVAGLALAATIVASSSAFATTVTTASTGPGDFGLYAPVIVEFDRPALLSFALDERAVEIARPRHEIPTHRSSAVTPRTSGQAVLATAVSGAATGRVRRLSG